MHAVLGDNTIEEDFVFNSRVGNTDRRRNRLQHEANPPPRPLILPRKIRYPVGGVRINQIQCPVCGVTSSSSASSPVLRCGCHISV